MQVSLAETTDLFYIRTFFFLKSIPLLNQHKIVKRCQDQEMQGRSGILKATFFFSLSTYESEERAMKVQSFAVQRLKF